ncbi:Ribokinase-like protein [Blastocladiella britannica]|nr:Ribokinase-like protein [Blastocladiella britannica]
MEAASAKVFVIGSINIDDVYALPHIVRPGETIAAASKVVYPGGKGANQSVAVARGGHTSHTYHVGAVGPDGQWVVDLMRDSGVDTSLVQVQPDASTGRAIIQLSTHSGENAIVLFPGTNHALTPESHFPIDTSKVAVSASRGDVVLLQNEISHGPAFLARARAAAATVVFNPAPCTPTIATEYDLALVDVLVVNEGELDTLATALGHPPAPHVPSTMDNPHGESEHWRGALAVVMERYSTTLAAAVVTLGARGAAVGAPGRDVLVVVPGLRIYPVDTTGAGDTFCGFLVAHLARNRTAVRGRTATDDETWAAVLRAVRVAAAAGSIACERNGAMVSIPELAAVEKRIQFAEQHE